MIRTFVTVFSFWLTFILPCTSYSASSVANILSINSASTNITTGAFVQLSAASPIAVSKMIIANATTSIIIVAVGASGSEVGLVAVGASSQTVLELGHALAASSRISLEALNTTASSGYISVSLIP